MIVSERYLLGITVDNTPVPDPSEFKYTVASLDASGERNLNGELKREMVASKHNLGLKWDALAWSTILTVLSLVQGESFTLSFPSPETGTTYTGKYYVGDREVDAIMMAGSQSDWYGSLSFNLIEF